MRVPMVDLAAQHAALRSELMSALARVYDSQRFILGDEVAAFEEQAAAFLGASFAVGVSSGTDALTCALLAAGITRGDEVLTTPFSFFATAEAILRVGATPRFVDIRLDTLNLDPTRLIGSASARTRAIVPVHLYGQPVEMDRVMDAAKAIGAIVVEDAAQAFAATYQGQGAGTWGLAGCFSFFPSKVLGALGDAGMIVTDDPEFAARCRAVRTHGAFSKHLHDVVGGNFRLDAMQAAVLAVKLRHLHDWVTRRKMHAEAYDAALSGIPGIVPPCTAPGASRAHSLYTVRVLEGRRDRLAAHLAARGIQTAVHYPRPLHMQPALSRLGSALHDLPNSERAADEVLSLPLYPELTTAQRDHVAEAIRLFLAS